MNGKLKSGTLGSNREPLKIVKQGREHQKDHRPVEVSHTVSFLGDQGEEHALSSFLEVGYSVGKDDPTRPNTPVKAAC